MSFKSWCIQTFFVRKTNLRTCLCRTGEKDRNGVFARWQTLSVLAHKRSFIVTETLHRFYACETFNLNLSFWLLKTVSENRFDRNLKARTLKIEEKNFCWI